MLTAIRIRLLRISWGTLVYQWVIFVDGMNSIPRLSADQVRCILRLLEKQHFAYLATSPAWNITSSLLAPPVSSQNT